MALKIPASLKLAQLKKLAFQCGVSSSGTKIDLIRRLQEIGLNDNRPTSAVSSSRLLSIDMGLRNLAYCIIDVPQSTNTAIPSLPSIVSWRRITVSAPTTKDDNAAIPTPIESFSPGTLSATAYNLLHQTLLPYSPTHVLIERQRFRSMGSPHVLEWTVRVNMFESMIYAVLHTLNAEKIWQGTVIPVTPGKVGPFWVSPVLKSDVDQNGISGSDSKSRKIRNTKSAKSINKGAKIDLVKGWLEDGKHFTLGSTEAEATAGLYLEKWNRLPGRKKGKPMAKPDGTKEVEELGKLDDLADSMLQGMAWIKWEQNRQLMLSNGVEALEDV